MVPIREQVLEVIEVEVLEQDKNTKGSYWTAPRKCLTFWGQSNSFPLLFPDKCVDLNMIRFSIFLLILLAACNSDKDQNQNEKYYMHVDGRDTSKLRLVRYENRFYGKYTHTHGGVAPVVGEINGDIKGDTLIGDNHYRPYRWKEKKRVPIVLLKKGNTYIEGTGEMIDLMGVLTYYEWTIKFDPPKRIYKAVEKFEE